MRFGIHVNIQKEQVFPVLIPFMYRLLQKGIAFSVNREAQAYVNDPALQRHFVPREELLPGSDMLLSFGGDGTLLSTARLAGDSEKPILGVNIGKLGFLTEVETRELDQALDQIIAGKYDVERRMVMEARSEKLSGPAYAFNDFVIARKDAIRMIRVRVDVDEEFLQSYTADGLIISSPTGSTAYSLSSSGPILTPSLEALVINPICPHVLTMRPLVISSKQTIRIQPEAPCHAQFFADGVMETDMDHRDAVIIREAHRRIHLVKLGQRSFFDILRTKLSWGEDARNTAE